MRKSYKIGILLVFAIFILRVCLSNDKKKEQEVLEVSGPAIALSVTPDLSHTHSVNPNVFGINIGFALKRELDKDSGYVQLLRALHPASLRFPGGTVANYYHPNLPVYGYKLGEIPPSLGVLYMEQSKRKENILYNYIRLCKLVGAKAVFCANVFTGTQEETLFVIGELKKNNIDILGVELGNEFCLMEYRKQFPDANAYIKKIKATTAAIKSRYPDLKLIVVGGDGVPMNEMFARSKFMRAWNQVLAKEKFYHAYSWHPYQDCPDCDRDEYFDKLYARNLSALAPQRSNYLYKLGVNLVNIYGPDKRLWLTEWNIGNLSYLDNTFMQAAYVSENFLTLIDLDTKFNNYYEVTNLHSIDGLITTQRGKLKPLMVNGTEAATAQYFSFEFLASTLTKETSRAAETISCSDTSVSHNFVCNAFVNEKNNKTYLHFVNRSGKRIDLHVNARPAGNMQLTALEGDYPYASAGRPTYEKTYPNKVKPLNYRSETFRDANVQLAPYAIGYIEYSN
jgi:hypothetical protein